MIQMIYSKMFLLQLLVLIMTSQRKKLMEGFVKKLMEHSISINKKIKLYI